MKKYILYSHPSLSVRELANLYRVPIALCQVVSDEMDLRGFSEEFKRKAVKLTFKSNGNYTVNSMKDIDDYQPGDLVTLCITHKLSRFVKNAPFKILSIDNCGNCETNLHVYGNPVVINFYYLNHFMKG